MYYFLLSYNLEGRDSHRLLTVEGRKATPLSLGTCTVVVTRLTEHAGAEEVGAGTLDGRAGTGHAPWMAGKRLGARPTKAGPYGGLSFSGHEV